MATPVEEFAAFNITEAMKLAKKQFEEYRHIASGRMEDAPSTVNFAGEPVLTVRGWYRIILHEEVRIKALKRQVNRLISGETIEGDDIPYPEKECWPEEKE
jgi:hypothetical protein